MFQSLSHTAVLGTELPTGEFKGTYPSRSMLASNAYIQL